MKKLRNKIYTYPVLSAGNDAYVNSAFSSSLECKDEEYKLTLTLKAELKNDELADMLKQGEVEIVHLLECPKTCYRKIVRTKELEETFELYSSEVDAEVTVYTRLIAVKDITGYTNADLSEDYQGFNYNFERGSVLAEGNIIGIQINKEKDILVNKSSIFTLVPNTDKKIEVMKVDVDNDKITIILPSKAYHAYKNKQKSEKNRKRLHAEVLVPALMKALYALKEARQELSDYSSLRWVQSIQKALAKQGKNLDEAYLSTLDPLEVAQKLLDSPVVKAVENFDE